TGVQTCALPILERGRAGRRRRAGGAARPASRLRMSRTGETPAPGPPPEPDVDPLRRALAPLTRPAKRVCWWLAVERDARLARFRSPDLAVFHDFAPPPAGGAHRPLRALLGEMGRRGVRIEYHRISATTRACLFN